jgi:hypothetical protein
MTVPISRDEIFQQLRQVLLDQFELRPEQIEPGAHLRDDLWLSTSRRRQATSFSRKTSRRFVRSRTSSR